MSDTTGDIPMTDAGTEPAAGKKPQVLNARKIRRRMESLGSAEPKAQRRKRNRMAMALLRQIADGRIADPGAAARAFVESLPETPETASEENAAG